MRVQLITALPSRAQWFPVGSNSTGPVSQPASVFPPCCCPLLAPAVSCARGEAFRRQRGLAASSLHPRFSGRKLSLDFRWCLISKCPFYSKILNSCFLQSAKGPLKWHVGGYRRHRTLPWRSQFGSEDPHIPPGADFLLFILVPLISSVLYSRTRGGIYSWNPILLFI